MPPLSAAWPLLVDTLLLLTGRPCGVHVSPPPWGFFVCLAFLPTSCCVLLLNGHAFLLVPVAITTMKPFHVSCVPSKRPVVSPHKEPVLATSVVNADASGWRLGQEQRQVFKAMCAAATPPIVIPCAIPFQRMCCASTECPLCLLGCPSV